MFFNRPDYDLSSAAAGTFAVAPTGAMVDALSRDYANTIAMIFGEGPAFEEILESVQMIELALNGQHRPISDSPEPTGS